MEIEVRLEGLDATEQNVLSLQDWLRQERVPGLKVEPKRAEPKPGEMGLEPITMLGIILGSPAVVELVRSIHVWIQTRRPKISMTVKTGDAQVTINAENVGDQESFVRNALFSLKVGSA